MAGICGRRDTVYRSPPVEGPCPCWTMPVDSWFFEKDDECPPQSVVHEDDDEFCIILVHVPHTRSCINFRKDNKSSVVRLEPYNDVGAWWRWDLPHFLDKSRDNKKGGTT